MKAPLVLPTVVVGLPMLGRVLRDICQRRFGAELPGIIALMLSGGEALEARLRNKAPRQRTAREPIDLDVALGKTSM